MRIKCPGMLLKPYPVKSLTKIRRFFLFMFKELYNPFIRWSVKKRTIMLPTNHRVAMPSRSPYTHGARTPTICGYFVWYLHNLRRVHSWNVSLEKQHQNGLCWRAECSPSRPTAPDRATHCFSTLALSRPRWLPWSQRWCWWKWPRWYRPLWRCSRVSRSPSDLDKSSLVSNI